MSNSLDFVLKLQIFIILFIYIRTVLVDQDKLTRYLNSLFKKHSRVNFLADSLQSELDGIDKNQVDFVSTDSVEQGSVVTLLNEILSNGYRVNASDIHIESDDSVLKVRFRVDGKLSEYFSCDARFPDNIVRRLKILSNIDVVHNVKAEDASFNRN